MSSYPEELCKNTHMAIDYANDMFGNDLNLIATTIFSSLELGNRIIVCSTYGNINLAENFTQSLNNIFVQRIKNVAAYSLNYDSRNLSILTQCNDDEIFAKQYNMVSHKGDLLLLIPGKSSSQIDKSQKAMLSLLKAVKEDQNLVMCISNSQDDSYITELLGDEDAYISFSDNDDDDVASIQLFYMFQYILKTIKQLLAN